jgi:hypothetical protein
LSDFISNHFRVCFREEGAREMGKNLTATIYTETGAIALVILSLKREGNKLVVDGKALGTMGMDMVLTIDEVVNLLKMLFCSGVASYMLLLPYFYLARTFNRSARKTKQ